MRPYEGLVRDTFLGDDLKFSGVAVSTGLVLSVLLWLIMPHLEAELGIPTAIPSEPPGMLILASVPISVGYFFVRNRGLLPTFLISFLPVYTVYYYLQTHSASYGVFIDPAPMQSSAVYELSVGYWTLGLGVAVIFHFFPNALELGSS